MGFVERIKTSGRLLKSSFAVMLDHPKLLVFPAAITACTFAILLFFLVPVAVQPTGHRYTEKAHWRAVAESVFTRDSLDRAAAARPGENTQPRLALTPQAAAYLALVYFASMFLATFFTTAFYHEILGALRGEGVSLRGGLRFAFTKLPAILLWSLFAGAVGYLIKSLEERVGLVAKLVLRFIGVAWSVAAVFAVPVIVLEEEKNPLAVLRRSAETIRKTWGESLAGFAGLQLGVLILLMWTVGILGIGIFLGVRLKEPAVILGSVGLWIAALAAFVYTFGVAGHIFRCALYLFAATGQVPGTFDREAMDLAWKIKKR